LVSGISKHSKVVFLPGYQAAILVMFGKIAHVAFGRQFWKRFQWRLFLQHFEHFFPHLIISVNAAVP
jgi:hypothetical protein